ncbi:MAG: ATP-binding cassette domain-containing protein [Bacillus sp. (in: firmicutes)]
MTLVLRKDYQMSEIKDEIILRGLKENNLKNVDLNIPKEKIIVFTGLSGSGKSSVVFDTLATESRRQMTLNYPLYVRNQMILDLTIDEVMDYFSMPKIIKRVKVLKEVGLGYLIFGQTTSSLSGGEVQRLKLASHLQKEGQIYLLDEPSLGLHKKDNSKLLSLFQHLVNRGNSVIIIEHNLDFIAASDWVIELGPGGGKQGGHIIFEGTPEEMLHAETLTAKWLGQRDRHRDPAR